MQSTRVLLEKMITFKFLSLIFVAYVSYTVNVLVTDKS